MINEPSSTFDDKRKVEFMMAMDQLILGFGDSMRSEQSKMFNFSEGPSSQ